MKIRTSLIAFSLFLGLTGWAQVQDYRYFREIIGVSQEWHQLELPSEIFNDVTADLRDLRIVGITENKDTIEAPYILRIEKKESANRSVSFQIINESHKNDRYYYTFNLEIKELINQIQLNFALKNYDWKIRLEGSNDQNEWFTLVDEYRILSIENSNTKYSYSTVKFKDSNFSFYRLKVKNDDNPQLQSVTLSKNETQSGSYKEVAIAYTRSKENRSLKRTEISIQLKEKTPLSSLFVDVENDYDYYRSLSIEYLVDSFQTEKGWKYNYRNLASGTLNSVDENEFSFATTTTKNLRLVIENQDNMPLDINSIKLRSPRHFVVARFTEPANYFLFYGNSNAQYPNYDIQRFQDHIPNSLTELSLGDVQEIAKPEKKVVAPLFENKAWLWGVLILIAILLGWTSFSMLRKS